MSAGELEHQWAGTPGAILSVTSILLSPRLIIQRPCLTLRYKARCPACRNQTKKELRRLCILSNVLVSPAFLALSDLRVL